MSGVAGDGNLNPATQPRPHIFFLCKFFGNESHATDFMKGRFYANKLSYFQKLEEPDPTRHDPHEGVIWWQQPGRVKVEIDGIDISNDLAGPVSLSSNRLRAFNVICMHAGYVENSVHPPPEDLDQIRKHLLIPEECKKFGEIAVLITNPVEWLDRIKAKARSCHYNTARGSVEYYDPLLFHGPFPGISGAFRKQDGFKREREYRIVFETGSVGDEPLILDIGDIGDVAVRTSINDINRNLIIRRAGSSHNTSAGLLSERT